MNYKVLLNYKFESPLPKGGKNDFLVRQICTKTRTSTVFEWFTAIGQDIGTSQAVSDVV